MLDKIARKIALYVLAGLIICTVYIFAENAGPSKPSLSNTEKTAAFKTVETSIRTQTPGAIRE